MYCSRSVPNPKIMRTSYKNRSYRVFQPSFLFPVFQYVLTDMVSDNPDELAVAAHNAYEQLQYNGHNLQHQVGQNLLQ